MLIGDLEADALEADGDRSKLLARKERAPHTLYIARSLAKPRTLIDVRNPTFRTAAVIACRSKSISPVEVVGFLGLVQ